mgnify:CR=1 FL=1|jgi:hypothetical protein|tara:strand:- start:724 stop:876 length:153 start_codon:yes stop_codon:yes gene_type:complete
MLKKLRPQVLLLTLVLGGIAAMSMEAGFKEIALACVVALAGAVTKLVERD